VLPSGAASTVSRALCPGRQRGVSLGPAEEGRHAASGIFRPRRDHQDLRVTTGAGAASEYRVAVKSPLPGEGVWHVAGRTTANGIPTMYEAFVRPDAVHTSYVVGVVWMDTNLLTAQLYSGSQIPVADRSGTTHPLARIAQRPLSRPSTRDS